MKGQRYISNLEIIDGVNMLKRPTIACVLGCLLVFVLFGASRSDEITIRVAGRSDGAFDYYHDLLRSALKEAGHNPIIIISRETSQKRWIKEFERGEIDIVSLVESADRNTKYTPIEIGITNNLIGMRILLISKGTSADYSQVKTLDDFRALNKSGGFGKNWFDVQVWEANNLKYQIVDGEWRNIYTMIASGDRDLDYFSRGANEIIAEARAHPKLEIEPRLLLTYERDVRFYLNDQTSHLKDIIEESLLLARQSGLLEELLKKHHGPLFEQLNFTDRVHIKLKTPK